MLRGLPVQHMCSFTGGKIDSDVILSCTLACMFVSEHVVMPNIV